MFFSQHIKSALILSLWVSFSLMGGTAYALDIASKEQSHSHKGYYKPGAAVSVTYDYDGQTEPGILENITLSLEHHYSSGYISARLLQTDDLDIISHQKLENEKLQAGTDLHMPIQISGTEPGQYFISLEVVYENLSGQRSLRVLSLPIHIGDLNISKTAPPSARKTRSEDSAGLVTFAAHEIIK
jgi:hypothetical protein